MRPRLLVVMTGTGTEVGKTWVGATLATELRRRGCEVSARKPAQSFGVGEPTDAERLAAATGERAAAVCPDHRWYPVPMAPPMAAAALDLPPPSLDELVEEVAASWPAAPVDVGLVEGAGGVASPLATDGDTAALAGRLRADAVVLVSEPGLGAINLVRLSVRALPRARVVVHLNRFDPADPVHLANRAWLVGRDGLEVTTAVADLAASLVPPN